jgi:uncharacterized membrane protein
MTASPPPTGYHRWLGWYAPSMRRAVVVSSIGLTVAVVLVWFLPWGMAVVAGWDAAALTFLLTIWSMILRPDGAQAAQLATREDETRGSAAVPLVGASVASLLGVVFALDLAGRQSGPVRVLLIGVAVATVVLSWTVVNTVYTLRYADLHYRSREAGIVFGDPEGQEQPTYRDFAYVAFTIGMCYQVSDTTLRNPTDPGHRALPRLLVVSVRGGDRGRLGQPHRRPARLTGGAAPVVNMARSNLRNLPRP